MSAYLEARKSLVEAYLQNPTVTTIYVVEKYGSVPVIRNDKKYDVKVRPNDVIETYTIQRDGQPQILRMRFVCSHNLNIVDEKLKPTWKQEKLSKWIQVNCVESEGSDDEDTDLGDTL